MFLLLLVLVWGEQGIRLFIIRNLMGCLFVEKVSEHNDGEFLH